MTWAIEYLKSHIIAALWRRAITETLHVSLTFSAEPGLSLLISLHSTTPFFSEDFKNSSGSQIVFLGESKTPKDISHVTILSSGFITEDGTLEQLSGAAARTKPHPRLHVLLSSFF